MTQESDGTLPAIQVHSKAPKTEQGEYGPGGRLLKKGTTSFEYDAKGRRTAKIKLADDGTEARTTYEWDGRDRLRSLKKPDGTTLTYSYDAFGRRVSKTVAKSGARPEQTAFVWDGEVLALELSAERGARTFVHEPGTFEPFLQEERGQIYLTVNDHLGMPKELVRPDGEISWSAAHSAYGRVIKTEGDGSGVESPFRLLGQVADDEAELCWTLHRCFDPEIGMWASPDPLELSGGLHPSAFDGAPTHRADPLGLHTSPEILADEVTGKSRTEIRDLADKKGLVPCGDKSDPEYPRKWKDPVTNQERLRLDRGHIDKDTGLPFDDAKARVDHVHAYKPDGQKVRAPDDNNPHFPTVGE